MKICLLLLVLPVATWAHPLDLGLLSVFPESQGLRAELRLNDELVKTLLGLPAGPFTVASVQARAEELRRRTLESGPLTAGDRTCRWKGAALETESNAVILKSRAECGAAAEKLVWQWPFLSAPGIPESFRLLARFQGPGGEEVVSADRARPELRFDGSSSFTFGRAVQMGMQHIGATPDQWRSEGAWHLPDGLDHILFVLALVLGGVHFTSLLRTVTGFTVGHSLTLALVALRIVHPPVRLVESLIALSIALVAWEALRGMHPERRWKWASAFGLVHGFGFGAALLELNLSGADLARALVGFNVGVELAQLVILAVLVPIFLALSKQPALDDKVRKGLSLVVLLAGAYWTIQRAFF